MVSSAVLRRRRRALGGFSPAVLFSAAEPGVWYDFSDISTLFQDTAGTQPVTAPGQTVALMLDKSKGLVLGPELVTNGDFSNGLTGWDLNGAVMGSVTASGGEVIYNNTSSTAAISQSGVITVSGYYEFKISITEYTAGAVSFFNQDDTVRFSAVGQYTVILYATVGETVAITARGTTTLKLTNISVRELPGFHATQPTAAARPTYGVVPETGRRNLLTYTEQLDNAAWVKTSGVTVESIGGGAWQINNFDGAVGSRVSQNFAADPSTTWKAAVELRGEGSDVGKDVQVIAIRRLSTGTLVLESVTVSLTTDWQRVEVPALTLTEDNIGPEFRLASPASNSAATPFVRYPQLELGSTATAYQRVTTQYDVTEAGVPSLGYLAFDGVDDFMVTPTITPGTDKVQVFAGVRKLSDAATAAVLEHSINYGTNNGSFIVLAPDTSLSGYRFGSSGSTRLLNATTTGFPAPVSNVLTGIGDIPGDLATLRVNGTQVDQNTGDQGTGNYLAYPLYIGRRGGTSLPFNGHIYSLITRFGDNLDANLINQSETYVAGKTGVEL